MEYIESRAWSLGFGNYSCNESEYVGLRELAKRLRLGRKVVQELDRHYKNVHAVDIPGLIRIGKMNAFIGMAHDAFLKGYCDTAKLIEKAEVRNAIQRDYFRRVEREALDQVFVG